MFRSNCKRLKAGDTDSEDETLGKVRIVKSTQFQSSGMHHIQQLLATISAASKIVRFAVNHKTRVVLVTT